MTLAVPGRHSAIGNLRNQHGQGWTRTSSLLFVRQALSAIELLALVWHLQGGSRTLTGVAHGALDAARLPFRHLDSLRDKGSNLDLRVQSAVSCRLDDPGSCRSVQLPVGGRRKGTSVRQRRSALVPSLLCPCHSPTLRPWIVGRERARAQDDVVVEGLWSRSLIRSSEMCRQKHTLMPKRNSKRRAHEQSFSLRRGLDSF